MVNPLGVVSHRENLSSDFGLEWRLSATIRVARPDPESTPRLSFVTIDGVGPGRIVDVGAPQLAMHSARELMGAADVGAYAAALAAFLAPEVS